MKEGHVIILICILLYAFSTHFYREKKYLPGVIFILGAAAVIRIYMGSHHFFGMWDERIHALVAKNMTENPFRPMLVKNPVLYYDYQNWSINHIWVHKQPLGLWLIAISYKIFGFNEFALRFPSLILSLITIFFIYRIGEKLFSAKIGWWSALCFSLVALPVTVSAGITCAEHVDTPFMCMITAGIYTGIVAVQKSSWWRFALAGFFMGCAVLSKWLPGLIVLGVVGAYMLHQRKISFGKICLYLSTLVAVGVVVFLPWQLYISHAFPREAAHEFTYNTRHFYEAIEGHGGSPWYHVDVIVQNWSIAFYILFPLFLFFGFKDKLGWKAVAIAVWVLAPIIFFSFAATKMTAYCLFTYPAIAICFGYTIDRLLQLKSGIRILAWIPILLFFIMAPLYGYDFMKLNATHMREEAWSKKIKELGKEKHEKPVVIFNTIYYIECMFYVDNCTAYFFDADSSTVAKVKSDGYDVLRYNYQTNSYEPQ